MLRPLTAGPGWGSSARSAFALKRLKLRERAASGVAWALTCALPVFALAGVARAQVPVIPAPPSTSGTSVPPVAASVGGAVAGAGGFSGMAGGDIGFGKLGDAYFLRLNIGTELRFDKIAVGLQIPLNIRLEDRCGNFALPDGCPQNARLRHEDWDEFADYARLIRYFSYGAPADPFYIRLGELWGATFGHGTVLSGYYNSINLDLYKLGIQLNVNTAYGGVQTMMDSLLQPSVFGMRGYVRPVSFWDPKSYWNNLAVGVTWMVDAFAPVGTVTPGVVRNGSGLPLPNEAMGILGFDVEFTVLQHKIIDVIPYTDVNTIFGAGTGWHLGVLTKLRPLEKFGLNLKLEYRYLGDGYVPAYFDSFYDIMKYQFPAGCSVTKFDLVRGRNPATTDACKVGLSGSGVYAEGVFDFFGLLTLMIAFEDAQGPNNSNLLLSLQLPVFDAVKLAAYYNKRFFDGLANAFSTDGAVLVGEARVRLYSMLYWIARYARSWQVGADGKFASADDFSVGIGVQARF